VRSLRHQRAAAADALKVSKDKEVWFIIGLGVFIIAVIAAALVGIKYARTCLLGDKAAAPKPPKVAPRQGADPSLHGLALHASLIVRSGSIAYGF
jgi:hypothetical protein